jgi:N-acetylglucosamine kinase
MKCVLGFDGGGTKTECVVLNETGAILVCGRGPASNPTRIGVPAALAALSETFEAAVNSTRISFDVIAVCAGLAGTARPENRDQVLLFLKEKFAEAVVDVRTDLDLVLSAMPEGPAIVLVCGTGSASIGRDAAGVAKREGGLGPADSDEGSAYDIGRSAIAASRAEPSSVPAEELARQILRHLGLSNWPEVDSKAATNADSVYPRVFPVVAAAAEAGNPLAQSLLQSAAQKLAALALRLAHSLDFALQEFPIAKTGGTIGRSSFFDRAIDDALRSSLPQAKMIPLTVAPSEVAAWIALQLSQTKKGSRQ